PARYAGGRVRRRPPRARRGLEERPAGMAGPFARTGRPSAGRSRKKHPAREARRQGLEPPDLARRPVEDWGRLHLGVGLLRSSAGPHLLWFRQSLPVEPPATAPRQ